MTVSEEETIRKYADIINLERYRPEDDDFACRHPRMPVSERAKIFAPFSALHHEGRLNREVRKLARQEREELSEEEAERLSRKLGRVRRGMKIGAAFFLPDDDDAGLGYPVRLEGRVTGLDTVRRLLTIGEQRIPFDDLTDLWGEGIEEEELW